MSVTNDAVEQIAARFRSGNSVPVERATVLADEWRSAEAEIARLRAEVERLDDGETQAIKERDHAEKIIDKLCDAVLGAERAEWSSGYFFEDAVDDVEAAIYRLRAEADALRVDAEALARVREIVRLTQKSVSDAYEAACRNGDERAQSVCNARASLLNTISEAMGADA